MSTSKPATTTPSGQTNLEKQKEQETAAAKAKADQAAGKGTGKGKEKKEDPAKDLDINKRADFHRKRLEYLQLKKSGDRARAAQAKKDWKEFSEEAGVTPDEEDEKDDTPAPQLPFGWNEGEQDILEKQQAQKQGIKEGDMEDRSKEIEEDNQVPNLEEVEQISKDRESTLKENK